MMNKYKQLVVLGISLFLLISCGKDAVIKRYFILDYPPTLTETTKTDVLPFHVKIEPFQIARSYNQDRIALRTRSNELQYYYHNNWAESPASAVRYFIWQKLKQCGFFQSCEMSIGEISPDYFVTGTISRIERLVREDDHAAHLKMILELKEINTGKTALVFSFDRSEPIEDDAKMNEFAQMISKILNEQSIIFIEQLYEALSVKQVEPKEVTTN